MIGADSFSVGVQTVLIGAANRIVPFNTQDYLMFEIYLVEMPSQFL